MEPPPAEVYPHRIAYNVIPQVEAFKDGDDYTTEERKVIAETRKVLGLPDLRITATCVRVPVVTGHSESVNVETRDDLSPSGRARSSRPRPASRSATTRPPASTRWPRRRRASDDVFVGRIRRDPSNERTLNLWIVGDNLRKGAALNAVQIAELLHARGLIGARTAA